MSEFIPTHLFKGRNSSLGEMFISSFYTNRLHFHKFLSFYLNWRSSQNDSVLFQSTLSPFILNFLFSSLSFCPFISKHFSPSFLVNFVAKITCLYLLGPIFYLLKTC